MPTPPEVGYVLQPSSSSSGLRKKAFLLWPACEQFQPSNKTNLSLSFTPTHSPLAPTPTRTQWLQLPALCAPSPGPRLCALLPALLSAPLRLLAWPSPRSTPRTTNGSTSPPTANPPPLASPSTPPTSSATLSTSSSRRPRATLSRPVTPLAPSSPSSRPATSTPPSSARSSRAMCCWRRSPPPSTRSPRTIAMAAAGSSRSRSTSRVPRSLMS